MSFISWITTVYNAFDSILLSTGIGSVGLSISAIIIGGLSIRVFGYFTKGLH